ncbi:MAG: hypothetical protein ACYDAI_04680 [Trichloromonadaceae bacterium]
MQFWPVFIILALFQLTGCDHPPTSAATASKGAAAAPAVNDPQKPPSPPIHEDFESAPRLSLFPRIGDYRPADDDHERLLYWKTYLEHLSKTSGTIVLLPPQQRAGRVFALRSVGKLESVGFFTPLAVLPERSYQVSLAIHTELPEGGVFGVGVVEFDRFLWVGEQYTEELARTHQTGVQMGLELRGQHPWQSYQFRFTTGPRTAMVHLVFFREGAADRRPTLFDEIQVELLP